MKTPIMQYNERNTGTTDVDSTTAKETNDSAEFSVEQLVNLDLKGMTVRMADFRERVANQTDEVWLVITCCDAREGMPQEIITVQTKDGPKKVQAVPVPTIGSGAPSRSRLRDVIGSLTDMGVSVGKIRIVVTQHGDSAEIASVKKPNIDHKITCGLRSLLQTAETELPGMSDLKVRFKQWVRVVKQERGIRWAPDREDLGELHLICPELMHVVFSASQKLHIPERLLVRALWRDTDAAIAANQHSVVERVYEEVLGMENTEWMRIPISSALYDHGTKVMTFDQSDDPKDIHSGSIVSLTQLSAEIQPRTVGYQDPDFVVTKFGENLIAYPSETILANMARGTSVETIPPEFWKYDNFFETVASMNSLPTLFCALAENYYPWSHRYPPAGAHDHGDNPNFKHLRSQIIICENEAYARTVRQMVKTEEYNRDFAETFSQIGELILINVNLDKPEGEQNPSWEKLILPGKSSNPDA